MPKIKKRDDLNKGLNIPIDIAMLNMFIKYLNCEFVTRFQISNLMKLMDSLNIENYNYSPEIQDRIKLIRLVCKAKVEENVNDIDILSLYVKDNDPLLAQLLEDVNMAKNQLSKSETDILSKSINERLQCLYVYKVKDDIVDCLSEFDKVSIVSYYDVLNRLKGKVQDLLSNLQNIGASDVVLRSFNFSDADYMDLLNSVLTRAKKPSTILMTGIRQLNALLSPGFMGGRLYCFVGGTGKFKSGTLLNIMENIRLYNPQIKPVENGMRKTILFVTMENTINETIERIFDMYNNTTKLFSECTIEEVIDILKKEGKFHFYGDDQDEEGICVEMRYYSDLEIATSHLYTIINDLADEGKEVIALVLDYILKIDSARENNNDERIRLVNTSKELKSLAQTLDIPVITAMQMNREGNAILDAAMRDNKEDAGKFIGNALVGTAWGMMQECDFICFINLEMQCSTGKQFLSFKRTKIRTKKDPLSVDYFNHPFVESNNARLAPDIMLDKPLSFISLASDLVSLDEDLEDARSVRPKISSKANGIKPIPLISNSKIDFLAS